VLDDIVPAQEDVDDNAQRLRATSCNWLPSLSRPRPTRKIPRRDS
jgi:hypothetical protein